MDKLYSRYLLEEHPISFHPTLAQAIGLNEAIMLQKINLWLNCKPKEANGRAWIYNSYKSWQEQLPFWSESTIRRTVKSLIDKEIILTGNFNKMKFDQTKWYSIDYEKVDSIVEKVKENRPCVQNEQTSCSNWTETIVQNEQTYTNEYTMNTNNDYCNEDVSKITKCYEENIGLITPATAELLFDYLKNMDSDLIVQAIKIASINNKRNGRYINGILRDWNNKGYKTLLDIQEEQQRNDNNANKKESDEERIQRRVNLLKEMMENDTE